MIYEYNTYLGPRRITSEEILQRFFTWWVQVMWAQGKEHLITEANCIASWVSLHKAKVVEEEEEERNEC